MNQDSIQNSPNSRPTLGTVDRPPADRRHARRARHFRAARRSDRTDQTTLGTADLRRARALFALRLTGLSPLGSSQSGRRTQSHSLARSVVVPAAHRFYQQHNSIFYYFFFFSIIVASFSWGLNDGLRLTLASAAIYTIIGVLMRRAISRSI